jgi:hypothetical protein
MARRLLIPVTLLFLVLLILGSLTPSDTTRTGTSTSPIPPSNATPPRTVEATLPGRDVRARVGDLVTLTVESDGIGGVEVPAFGESEPVAPGSPAIFDLLPTEPGRYVVRSAGTGAEIGALVVEEVPAEETEDPA